MVPYTIKKVGERWEVGTEYPLGKWHKVTWFTTEARAQQEADRLNGKIDYVKIAVEAGAVIEEMKYGIEAVITEVSKRVLAKQKAMQKMVEAGMSTSGTSSQIDGLMDAFGIISNHLSKYLDPEENLKPIIITSKKICGSWSDLINGEIVTSLNITPDGISAVVGSGTYKLSPDQFSELKFINNKACSECGRSFEDD